MGLDIKLLIGVKPHVCARQAGKAGREHEVYAKDSAIFAPQSGWYEGHAQPYRYKVKTCDCKQERINNVSVGYLSVHSGQLKPGDLYEYDSSDGFYFGSYSIWASLINSNNCPETVGLFSDCDGSYSGGPFLRQWYSDLKKYLDTSKVPHEKWKAYYALLDQYKDVLDTCMIIHC